jgi:hypothetical protein
MDNVAANMAVQNVSQAVKLKSTAITATEKIYEASKSTKKNR